MPAEILLRPGNRALDYSITDFSHYGAQPTTTVQFAPSSVPGGQPSPHPQDQSISAESPGPTALAPAPELAPFLPEADTTAEETPDSGGRISDGDDAPASQAAASDALPLVPAPVGSSSPLVTDSTVAREGIDDSRATVNDVRAADVAPSDVGGLSSNVGTLFDAQAIAALPATAAALVANGISETLQALHGTVTTTLDGLAGNVAGAASGIATEISEGSAATVSALDPSGVVDGVAEAVSAPVELLGDTVGAVADTEIDLSQLGGSDPAAGVATLVDMVTTDNLFDLRDAGAPPDAPDPATSPIDQLAGEVPDVSPLLGEAAQHHDDAGPDLSGGTLHDDLGI